MSIENQVNPSYNQPPPDFLEESAIDELSQLALPPDDKRRAILDKFQPTRDALDVVWNGLASLAGHKPAPERVTHDTRVIFAGLEKAATVYGLFVGPATVIGLYQSLLKLAGVNPDNAFPNGTWQFYVEYALREDTARHTVETDGFHSVLAQHQIEMSEADRMAAWVMASIYCLQTYDRLLQNEWRERVYLYHLREVMWETPQREKFAALYRVWEQQRPYGRGRDAQNREDYPTYRRNKFDEFLQEAMQSVPTELRREWVERVSVAKESSLEAYQEQMSILAHLAPNAYDEARKPIPFEECAIGLIYQGHYYLLPVIDKRTGKLTTISNVRSLLAALVNQGQVQEGAEVHLAGLATVQRASWPATLNRRLAPELLGNLKRLETAPILLNFDERLSELALSQIRQAERGVGSHALTIFDTGKTAVFDLSHIFFDGIWGAGIAEILTNEALAWAVYLHRLPPAPVAQRTPRPLQLELSDEDWLLLHKQPRIQVEACAETSAVNQRAIRGLRRLFKQRSDQLKLTVNDLLILYRAIHAQTYQLDPDLHQTLATLAQREKTREAVTAVWESLHADSEERPSVLIPVDASKSSPRDRLHPVSFEVPLDELDVLTSHRRTLAALTDYTRGLTDYQTFDTLQRDYLSTLAVMGEIFSRVKEIASLGQSTSVGSIKLLAHLPKSLQQLLNKIPEQFEVLNDLLKGREVFSNIGAVVGDSTLTRFLTAKDDNEQKTLAWGVMTNREGEMVITLRDFRPHVAQLVRVGHQDLANRITQDYLDSYALGLNDFVHDLMRITLASYETAVSTKSRPLNG
ncbi:MAG: hypothetical protein AAF614_13455 [Chloroflexota bacterium]